MWNKDEKYKIDFKITERIELNNVKTNKFHSKKRKINKVWSNKQKQKKKER